MSKNRTRRALLTLSAAGLFVWGVNTGLRRWGGPGLAFEPLEDPKGFRRVVAGEVSRGAFNPLVGLEPAEPGPPRLDDARLCDALFAERREGTVPVAAFSDYFCPYCRVLTEELAARHAAGRITITWHELPLLSPLSEPAARAALAAGLQGEYPAFHARLMRSRVAAEADYLRSLADSAGLDADRLIDDLTSEEVTRKLVTAQQLADRFRLYGTPAIVVGQTLVLGSVTPATLDDLIAIEADLPPVCSA
ncbi:DsbA family protein [Ovoidimarina sediminis]|uniref:DsbA family protein n=1 Tax=Ovoidimarina sediminis TaxID=3079856 RepID=UPI0029106AEA|nr:DsbA family protein [Rhodophyticola sp. MJ-SS7]MDU8942766.1 DsbA family protein [Rhodophyticola sp. MJ-SS7]